MNYDFRKRVVFPAVTVCNNNRLRASKLHESAYQSIADIDDDMEQNGIISEFDDDSYYEYLDISQNREMRELDNYVDNDLSSDYVYHDISTQENFKVSAL